MAHEETRSLGTERGEELYTKSGELLGIFPSPEAATEHALRRSNPEQYPGSPVPIPEVLRERASQSHVTVVRAPDGVSFMVVPLAFPEQEAFDPADPVAVTREHVDRARRRAWILWDKGARYRTYPDLVTALDAAQAVNEQGGGESIFDRYLDMRNQGMDQQDMQERAGARIPSVTDTQIPVPPQMLQPGLQFPIRRLPPPESPSIPGRLPAPRPFPEVAAPTLAPVPGRWPQPQLQTSAGRSLSPELIAAVTGESAQTAPSLGLRLARRAREPGRLAGTLTSPY